MVAEITINCKIKLLKMLPVKLNSTYDSINCETIFVQLWLLITVPLACYYSL